jgi:hypothetical protein
MSSAYCISMIGTRVLKCIPQRSGTDTNQTQDLLEAMVAAILVWVAIFITPSDP